MIAQYFLTLIFSKPWERITSDLKLPKDKEIIDKATYKNIKPVLDLAFYTG